MLILGIFALGWACLPVFAAPAAGQSIDAQEYPVKAGFIYHFVRFTQWPPEAFSAADAPLVLCLASTTPESDVILSLEGKAIKGRRLRVIRLDKDEKPEGCHALFIASADKRYISRILKLVEGKSVLTIGEIDGFAGMGGIINFVTRDNRLTFRVNLGAADLSGLKFSSQLLMSAEIVQEGR